MASIFDVFFKQLKPLIEGSDRNPLLCEPRPLSSFYVLTLGFRCSTLVADGVTFVALYL